LDFITFVMKSFRSAFLVISLTMLLVSVSQAVEIVGMQRSKIVEQFGEPQSILKSSSREILNYAQGQIIIVQGRVSTFKGTFSTGKTPVAATVETPVEKPAQVVQAAVVETSDAPDMTRRSVEPFWWSYTMVEAQKRSKEKDGRPILALFTGPDWCGPCQQLEAQVLDTDEFKRLGRKQFIPLKIALYMNTYQSTQAKQEYHSLSEKYGITGVPSFVILDSDGSLIAKPDLFKRRKGITNFKDQTLAAILEAEKPSGILHFKWQIGIAVVVGGGMFVYLRR
jgi:thiol-disulfide isomerase/thioredoxin